jgi:hypothetical protein
MTGTPLDMTPFGPLLSALGLLYWTLALCAVGFALWKPRAWPIKVLLAALVIGAFAFPVVRTAQTRQAQRDEGKERLDASMALFTERCKGAGERIVRTVQNVDGVVWMKWREPISNADNFADQFKLNDPYGSDCGAEDCLLNLLRLPQGMAKFSQEARKHAVGYTFVESIDPRDERRYRYTGTMTPCCNWTAERIAEHRKSTGKELDPDAYRFTLERESIGQFSARYGIRWDDISTREDREHWIAGGSLKVIDLKTNEVIAERVGYMIDQGQGSQAGFRSPWASARDNACPMFRLAPDGRAYFDPVSAQFAQRVLRPTT